MTQARPFTPDMLAERWGCSGETVRQMVKTGRLPGFRVGRMIRITAKAVEEYECQISRSGGSEADCVSIGTTIPEPGDVISLTHATERQRKPKR